MSSGSAHAGRATAAHALDPIFRPRSVAVVGASSDPRKRGYQVLEALTASGYEGAVYPVNPRGGDIGGRTVYESVNALPEPADLALICLPAGAVGFGESGEEGARLSQELADAASETGIRVVGPNTSGILNLPIGLNLIGARGVRPGDLSILVQSGNVALSFMNEVTARSADGVGICVGVGNELDIGFHEYLSFLGADPGTKAVAAYAEGFSDARSFVEVASRVTRSTPVVLLKGARSESGQAAARSHTGAVAGEHERLAAALRQAGVVEVTRADELFHVTQTLASQPAVAGSGVAILSDGGGQGTLASDALSDMGVPLATLSDATRDALRALLGRAANVANPVDLAGAADGDPVVFAKALDILSADAAVGPVLVVGLFGGYGIRFAEALTEGELEAASRMAAGMSAAGKPLVMHTMYAAYHSEPLDVLRAGRVPVVESLDVAVRCVAEVWRRADARDRRVWNAAAPFAARSDEAAEVLDAVVQDGRDTLTEPEATAVLSAHGLHFPHVVLCTSPEEVAEAMEEVGSPAVMKVVSESISHKTDAGGVMLGLDSVEDAVQAFAKINESCTAYLEERGLPVEIEGVLLTRMLGAPLVELLIGGRRDEQLGPMLTIGTGGTWVEVLKDVTHRVLPVSDEDIAEMMLELGCFPMLAGARGRPKADIGAIVQAARAVAACVESDPRVADVEVNPLFAYAEGALAVDARLFVSGDAAT